MNQERASLFPRDPSPEEMRRCSKRGCGELNPPMAEFCSRCGRALERADGAMEVEGMEIPLGNARRIWGFLAWIVLVAIVASVLVVLFVQFTASVRMALALVVFLLGYMAVMAWITMGRK